MGSVRNVSLREKSGEVGVGKIFDHHPLVNYDSGTKPYTLMNRE